MAAKASPVYSDEIKIDLGKYIETLVRQWVWILAWALGLGILAILISHVINLTSPSYQASAIVASSKTLSVVNFGGPITSQSETDLAAAAASGAQYLFDRKARLQSYVALVRNGAVAEQVLAQVGPKLKPAEQNTASLLDMVNGSLVPNTDSIRIAVTYNDPVIAAEIANDWAQAFVVQINDIYGDSSTGASLASVEQDAGVSKTAYDTAQKALTDFEAQNKSAEYQRQIDQLTTTVTDLRLSLTTIADQEVQSQISSLKQAYTDKLQVREFMGTVASMQAAVKAGGDPAAVSNALALTLLKSQIYAAFQGSNTLQVQNLPESLGTAISAVNAAGMLADLEALNSTLSDRSAQLDATIAALSTGIQNGTGLTTLQNTVTFSAEAAPIERTIAETEQKIRDLNSQVSLLNAQETELTKARDLAWQSYSALETKGSEMSVAAQTTGSEVIFASLATPPKDKALHSGINALIASAVGLLIGLVGAYAYEFWQTYKGRKSQSIILVLLAAARDAFRKRSPKSPQDAAAL